MKCRVANNWRWRSRCGLPDNVTTEMDLVLWDTSQAIRSDAVSLPAFQEQDAESLASAYLSGTLPPVAQDALTDFLDCFGMRGLGEIDFGRTALA